MLLQLKTIPFGFLIVSVLTTLIFVAFSCQCLSYKWKQKLQSNAYTTLTGIGFIYILGNCISVFANIFVYNDNIHLAAYITLLSLRASCVLLHCLFFVWRLHLTFINSDLQLSNKTIIIYHICILFMFIVCGTEVVFLTVFGDNGGYFYFFISCEILRTIILSCVSFQFVTKLLKLIVTHHKKTMDSRFRVRNRIPSDDNNNNNNNNNNNINNNSSGNKNTKTSASDDYNTTVESFSDDGDDAIINVDIKKVQLISDDQMVIIATKLTILAIFDCLFVIGYVAVCLIRFFDINNYIWTPIHYIGLMLYCLATAVTVWLSFRFADRQYHCLFYCCHKCGMQICIKIAWKRIFTKDVDYNDKQKQLLNNETSSTELSSAT